MKTIAILGTGGVGQTFALKFASLGYEVMIGTRNVAEKLASIEKDGYGNPPFSEWYAANRKSVKLGTFAEAAAFGETILNATMGGSSIQVLNLAGANNLAGKILIDVANPLDFSKGMPPSLLTELSNTNSLGEEIQKSFPDVKVVKTLNTMWCGLMVNPGMINNGDHTNFICGNDAGAKSNVKEILKSFGWAEKNILDLGEISAARGTEAVLPVWLRIWGATQNGAFNLKVVS
ncbi:MAG: NAD(P)-binding domain-containing protein [Bacteroidetes bacterium]|nr:NAD(P)-binding domain-containing protein [Bacteroidota bacterium]